MISFLSFMKKSREFTVLLLLALWGIGLFSYANSLFPESMTEKPVLQEKSAKKKCSGKKTRMVQSC